MESPNDVEKQMRDTMKFVSNKEYQAKFLLTPDIQNDADFTHIDKNTAITNLKQRVKGEVDEVSTARMILQARHVLNNPKYYKTVEKEILLGHEKTIKKDGSQLLTPIFENRKVQIPLFPKSSHMLNAKYYSFVITASARNGHRVDKAIANRLEKEEKLSDKTDIDSGKGFFKNKGE